MVDAVRKYAVNEIIVAVRDRRGGALPMEELLECKLAGVKVTELSNFFERERGQLRLDSLNTSWLIFGEGFRQDNVRETVKRAFDITASLMLLIVALPFMAITALAILLEDGAPVLYRQERVGQGGSSFNIFKFRSMRKDAERDGKPRWASTHDDRTTRVGTVIRKLRVDELPQIFNVLRGEMSLVGPRPKRPFFVKELSEEIPLLQCPAQRQTGDQRLGPDSLSLRSLIGRLDREAAVRSVLREESHSIPRRYDSSRDRAGCPLGEGRSIDCALSTPCK